MKSLTGIKDDKDQIYYATRSLYGSLSRFRVWTSCQYELMAASKLRRLRKESFLYKIEEAGTATDGENHAFRREIAFIRQMTTKKYSLD